MNEYIYLTLRENKKLKEPASSWFHNKWGISKEDYLKCMEDYINNKTEYGWYLCLHRDKIIGGVGIIENDFHNRKDLKPNVCALYVEEEYRSQGIGGKLLYMAVDDMKHNRVSPLYLITDHKDFYERYGWEFLCMVKEEDGNMTRMYICR